MAILKYVMHLNRLSTSRGMLAKELDLRAVSEANWQMQAVLREGGQKQQNFMW